MLVHGYNMTGWVVHGDTKGRHAAVFSIAQVKRLPVALTEQPIVLW